MTFDELKPGIVLYHPGGMGLIGKDWIMIQRKTNQEVVIDDYWEAASGRCYKNYNTKLTEREWNNRAHIYISCELITPIQTKKLIVWLFEKGQ